MKGKVLFGRTIMDKIYEIYERYSAYEFEEILDFYANYDYSQYDGIKAAAASAGVSWLIAIGAIIGFIALTLAVLSYVFYSVGLFKMAKNLGIVAPWLAFIPVANLYMLGRVAQGNGETKRKFPFGWVLLILTFASAWLESIFTTSIVTGLAKISGNMTMDNVVTSLENIFAFIGGPLVTNLALSVLSGLLVAIFFYITLYFAYKECTGGCAPVYLAVSIVFPIFIPFFLFAKRNSAAKKACSTTSTI